MNKYQYEPIHELFPWNNINTSGRNPVTLVCLKKLTDYIQERQWGTDSFNTVDAYV